MQTVIAKDRQTLFDLALQVWGRAELAYDLAEANGLCLSDEVSAGEVLLVPTVDGKTDRAVVDAYDLESITPATSASPEELDDLCPSGIAYWFIKSPTPIFIVSPNTTEEL